MLDSLQPLITDLAPYLQQYGLWILALAIAVEGVGIPAPGQSLLIVAAVLAAGGDLSLTGVLTVATLSAFFGNLAGYFIGLKGDRWLRRRGWLSERTEQRLHAFITRHGTSAMVISRFVEGLKQTLPLGTGLAQMPLAAFLLANALASLIWVAVFGAAPALLRHHFASLQSLYQLHPMAVWGVGLSLLLATAGGLWHRARRRTAEIR
ncbi:DedA family protein [Ferrimonas balearica]|uniref:DedA family protein n=1 Tax=Ferrimonas balearica TaxID=44012 RepID=UPI001C99EBB9|nr:DedA family protein [Ferrimonas balearica]MBY5994133.1 DedA family protein [Ferrimonas balearica]